MSTKAPKKERNYAIQFYRLMFCMSFVLIHVYQVFPGTMGKPPVYLWNLDCMLPFMAISGYFLMQNYQGVKKKAAAANEKTPPASVLAGKYLLSRIKGLYPIYLIGTLLGFVIQCLKMGTKLIQIPLAILNELPEWLAIQITGIGIGNKFAGDVILGGSQTGTGNAGSITLNAPLWFISAIFIAGFIVYFCIAKWEETYLTFVTPILTFVLFATHHLTNTDAMWLYYDYIGNFMLNAGLLKMILLMSVGALMWKGVNKLKDYEFTGPAYVFVTICQTIMGIFIVYRTWTPYTHPTLGLPISFSSVYLLSVPFTFLLLLNKDGFTRAMNLKIWDFPGKLALHFYILHYPLIFIIGRLPFINGDLMKLFITLLIVDWTLSVLLYLLDQKVLQPWIKSWKFMVKKEEK